ncbi:MAG: response regulator [Pseudomonadota bacterium]|nr:response regulator [Pseudomonadota bacterium]
MILVAEDDADDRLLIGTALARTAINPDVRYVTDGRALLDYLRREGPWCEPRSSPRPDLVLLDLNMPRMSGRDGLRVLKQDPALRCVPIVVFTTSDDPRDVETCYDAGANAFVTKPCTIAELTRALAAIVEFWLAVAARRPLYADT